MAVVSTFFNGTDNKWTKTCVIIGGCAVFGISVYSVYSYFKNKSKMVDEGFEDISMVDDTVKKILVLGLNGAGKSSLLSHLSRAEDNSKPEHTEGISVVVVHSTNEKTLNFWEIEGSENIRAYWSNFVHDTDVLIYIVDSADDHRLAESILELHKLTACDKLKKVPIIILANKQDLPNAASPENIAEAFGVVELSRYNKIQVLPLQVPVDAGESHESVSVVKDTVIKLCSGK